VLHPDIVGVRQNLVPVEGADVMINMKDSANLSILATPSIGKWCNRVITFTMCHRIWVGNCVRWLICCCMAVWIHSTSVVLI